MALCVFCDSSPVSAGDCRAFDIVSHSTVVHPLLPFNVMACLARRMAVSIWLELKVK